MSYINFMRKVSTFQSRKNNERQRIPKWKCLTAYFLSVSFIEDTETRK